MMADHERRVVTVPIEARAGEHAERTLSGYAALYGEETRIGSFFREVIARGAFTSALTRRDDVRGLFNHNPDHVLGRTAAGTLRLAEDARGLRYDLDLPDTQLARDLWVSVQRGDVSQSSFAFSVTVDHWPPGDVRDGLPLRVIKDVQLFDVSAVTYPAYNDTTVAARSQAAHLQADAVAAAVGRWRAMAATLRAKAAMVDVCGRRRH